MPSPASALAPRLWRIALAGAGLLGCARAPSPAPPGAASSAPRVHARPTLVVLVAVDQLRADYFPRFDRQLTGGLARFWREGTFFTGGR